MCYGRLHVEVQILQLINLTNIILPFGQAGFSRVAGRGEILNKILYGGEGGLSHSPTPYPFIYHFGQKRYTPFVYLLLISGTLYLFYFIHFATTNVQRKEEKNALQNRSGVEALNRNHRAYNIRLPQSQLMMATHAQL